MDKERILNDYFHKLKTPHSEETVQSILAYLELVHARNQEFNLVGTKSKDEIFIRHFLDSISFLENQEYWSHKKNLRILDLGTGAGLPGVLLALILREHRFCLLDKSLKKVRFLQEVQERLGIENMAALHGDAALLAHREDLRESFDITLARAVTKIQYLLEIIIPFCRINGKIILYKSRQLFHEMDRTSKALGVLGAKTETIRKAEVPHLEEYRAFLVLSKTARTPSRYPRNGARIKKEPLV